MGKFKAISNDKKESGQLYFVLHNIKTGEDIKNKKMEIIAKENGLNTRRLNNYLNTNKVMDEKYLVTRQGDHGEFYHEDSYLLEGEILDFSKINTAFYKMMQGFILNASTYKSLHKSYCFLTADDRDGAFVFFMYKIYEMCKSENPIVCMSEKIRVRSLIESYYKNIIRNLIAFFNTKKRKKHILKKSSRIRMISIEKNNIDREIIESVDCISTEGLKDSLGKSHQVLLRELYGEDGSIKSYRKNTGKSIHKALRLNESLKLEALKHLIATTKPSKLIRKFAFAIRNLESIKVKTEGNDKILFLLREYLIDQNVRIENIGEMRGEIMQVGNPCKRKFEHNV